MRASHTTRSVTSHRRRRRAASSPAGRTLASGPSGMRRRVSRAISPTPAKGLPHRSVLACLAAPPSTPRRCSSPDLGRTPCRWSDSALGAPPHRKRLAIEGSRCALGKWRRSGPPAADAAPAAGDFPRSGQRDLGEAYGAGTVARISRPAATAGRGAPHPGRVRSDAVGEVGGDRDSEHPRMGGPGFGGARSGPGGQRASYSRWRRGRVLRAQPP
jgi:hypothetical protein